MKKFYVTIPVDYVDGYLRYGHLEGIIEAENEVKAKEKAEKMADSGDLCLVIDDYEIQNYDSPDFSSMTIKEK